MFAVVIAFVVGGVLGLTIMALLMAASKAEPEVSGTGKALLVLPAAILAKEEGP